MYIFHSSYLSVILEAQLIIHPNNRINDVRRAKVHSYKVCDDNVWLHLCILNLLQPLSDCHVTLLILASMACFASMHRTSDSCTRHRIAHDAARKTPAVVAKQGELGR